MIIRKKYLLALLPILLLAYCKNKQEQSMEEVKTYFDLKNYFAEQGKILNDRKVHLYKQITKDGKSEEKIFNQTDWQKELKPFSDCDINKPAWIHSYFVDTVVSTKNRRVRYVARESSLPVQQLNFVFEKNKLIQLSIHKQTANSYYTSKNDYVFIPDSGYTINGSQEVMLAEKTNYSIKAKFVK